MAFRVSAELLRQTRLQAPTSSTLADHVPSQPTNTAPVATKQPVTQSQQNTSMFSEQLNVNNKMYEFQAERHRLLQQQRNGQRGPIHVDTETMNDPLDTTRIVLPLYTSPTPVAEHQLQRGLQRIDQAFSRWIETSYGKVPCVDTAINMSGAPRLVADSIKELREFLMFPAPGMLVLHRRLDADDTKWLWTSASAMDVYPACMVIDLRHPFDQDPSLLPALVDVSKFPVLTGEGCSLSSNTTASFAEKVHYRTRPRAESRLQQQRAIRSVVVIADDACSSWMVSGSGYARYEEKDSRLGDDDEDVEQDSSAANALMIFRLLTDHLTYRLPRVGAPIDSILDLRHIGTNVRPPSFFVDALLSTCRFCNKQTPSNTSRIILAGALCNEEKEKEEEEEEGALDHTVDSLLVSVHLRLDQMYARLDKQTNGPIRLYRWQERLLSRASHVSFELDIGDRTKSSRGEHGEEKEKDCIGKEQGDEKNSDNGSGVSSWICALEKLASLIRLRIEPSSRALVCTDRLFRDLLLRHTNSSHVHISVRGCPDRLVSQCTTSIGSLLTEYVATMFKSRATTTTTPTPMLSMSVGDGGAFTFKVIDKQTTASPMHVYSIGEVHRSQPDLGDGTAPLDMIGGLLFWADEPDMSRETTRTRSLQCDAWLDLAVAVHAGVGAGRMVLQRGQVDTSQRNALFSRLDRWTAGLCLLKSLFNETVVRASVVSREDEKATKSGPLQEERVLERIREVQTRVGLDAAQSMYTSVSFGFIETKMHSQDGKVDHSHTTEHTKRYLETWSFLRTRQSSTSSISEDELHAINYVYPRVDRTHGHNKDTAEKTDTGYRSVLCRSAIQPAAMASSAVRLCRAVYVHRRLSHAKQTCAYAFTLPVFPQSVGLIGACAQPLASNQKECVAIDALPSPESVLSIRCVRMSQINRASNTFAEAVFALAGSVDTLASCGVFLAPAALSLDSVWFDTARSCVYMTDFSLAVLPDEIEAISMTHEDRLLVQSAIRFSNSMCFAKTVAPDWVDANVPLLDIRAASALWSHINPSIMAGSSTQIQSPRDLWAHVDSLCGTHHVHLRIASIASAHEEPFSSMCLISRLLKEAVFPSACVKRLKLLCGTNVRDNAYVWHSYSSRLYGHSESTRLPIYVRVVDVPAAKRSTKEGDAVREAMRRVLRGSICTNEQLERLRTTSCQLAVPYLDATQCIKTQLLRETVVNRTHTEDVWRAHRLILGVYEDCARILKVYVKGRVVFSGRRWLTIALAKAFVTLCTAPGVCTEVVELLRSKYADVSRQLFSHRENETKDGKDDEEDCEEDVDVVCGSDELLDSVFLEHIAVYVSGDSHSLSDVQAKKAFDEKENAKENQPDITPRPIHRWLAVCMCLLKGLKPRQVISPLLSLGTTSRRYLVDIPLDADETAQEKSTGSWRVDIDRALEELAEQVERVRASEDSLFVSVLMRIYDTCSAALQTRLDASVAHNSQQQFKTNSKLAKEAHEACVSHWMRFYSSYSDTQLRLELLLLVFFDALFPAQLQSTNDVATAEVCSRFGLDLEFPFSSDAITRRKHRSHKH